jgi:hypothetical protein
MTQDIGQLVSLLDHHTTSTHVRRLQLALREKYPDEIAFRSYENLRGYTKFDKIDHILEVLETYDDVEAAIDAILKIKPADQALRVKLRSAEIEEDIMVQEYTDFELHIGPDGRVRARSDEGERKAVLSLDIPSEVSLTVNLIEENKTSESLLKEFGKRLYEIILPRQIDKHFNQTEAMARGNKQKVRIRLTIEPDALARLPWEFAYREEGGCFLATNPETVLSHYLDLSIPKNRVRRREGPLYMLTIISNPNDQPQLDVDNWERIINGALATPLEHGLVTLKTVKQATFYEIRDALFGQAPDIVQFVGHGIYRDGKGYLALVDSETEGTWIVDDTQFAGIFLGGNDHLGLVCLATCESAKSDSPKSFLGIAPKIVQKGVPAVVAMRYVVLVSTAEIFLENFYTALAARKPVDWAVQWARNAVSIKTGLDNREFATPVLYMRAKDGNIF